MPHRSADQAAAHGYNAHIMGGRTHPPPPPVHMIHPSEAARMAAYQRPPSYGAHPAYFGHQVPPPMWHPADAAAHLTHAEMHRPDAVISHTQRADLHKESSPARRIRTDTMESAEETAASALLMASGMGTSPKTVLQRETEQQESSDGQEPPKKRKKHLDVLRRNQPDSKLHIDPTTGSPCHISPGSASSREGDGQTDEIVTIVTSSSRTLLEASSGSYDARETKKEHVLLHFPSVLHKVLDQPDVRSVLQWLPHGEAWRIVRWDALRREVLPHYFPQLCKGDAGSIDAFLAQVRGWGFEEIIDGPDAGAYRHLSFVRGTHKLCKHMIFQGPPLRATESNSPSSAGGHNEGSTAPGASQSILQVPSLTSRSDGEQEPKQPSPEQQRLNNTTPSGVQHVQERTSPVHPGWQHGGMAMSYRTRDGGYADPRLVHQTSPLRHGVTFPPPYSPRFPFRTPGGPPSPLKSGRGGSRLASRNSFPVSQRGKGGRPRIVRSPITTPDTKKSVGRTESEETRLPAGLGPHLQKESAIASISRKMTRKLPLARKSPETAAKVTPTAADGVAPNAFAESQPSEVMNEVSQTAEV